MTKYEFLDGLKNALENDLSGSIIQENVNYYREYIEDEVRKGRSESEVLDELGDPWVIAQTIIDSAETSAEKSAGGSYDYEDSRYSQADQGTGKVRFFRHWWEKWIFIIGLIGIVVLLFAVVGGLLSILAPIIIPAIVVGYVFRIINRNRR